MSRTARRGMQAFVLLATGCTCGTGAGSDAAIDTRLDAAPPADVVVAVSPYGACSPERIPGFPPAVCRDEVPCREVAGGRHMCTQTCDSASDCPAVEHTTVACLPLGADGENICVLNCDMSSGRPTCLGWTTCVFRERMQVCFQD